MNRFENNIENNPQALPHRELFQAMRYGALQKCPSCGQGKLFNKYLKVADQCGTCGEALHHHRADDAPAYFTIAIVGKIIVGLMVWVELAYTPSYWFHAALWTPLLLVMTLTTLPVIKGTIVGLQWANYMHGFNPNYVKEDDIDLTYPAELAENNKQ